MCNILKCKICGKEFKSTRSLGLHLRGTHQMSSKEYYDIYLRKEGEGACIMCGKPTTFINVLIGYCEHCSNTCAHRNPKIMAKVKATNLRKYGHEYTMQNPEKKKKQQESLFKNYKVTNPTQSKEIREKVKKTNLERYGVKYTLQLPKVKGKIKETNLKKYGVENVFGSKEIQDKKAKTFIKKYGVDNPWKSDIIKKQIADTNQKIKTEAIEEMAKKRYVLQSDIIEEYDYGWYFSKDIGIENCIYKNLAFIKKEDIEKIKAYKTNFKPSSLEREVRRYIESIYNGKIEYNCRNIIKRPETNNFMELDIYLPSENLAIECNGAYYHSIIHTGDPYYHLLKTKLCSELGIQLIHITDWEWLFKKEICKSIISSALGIYSKTINAEDCIVKEVSKEKTKEFLNNNHIDGDVDYSLSLGLFYKDNLVKIAVFKKITENQCELLRVCNKLNFKVEDGLEKIMSELPNHITEVIHYLDISKVNSEEFLNANWQYLGTTEPSYNYHKGKKRYSKNTFTEEELESKGFYKVYNCGYFILSLKR